MIKRICLLILTFVLSLSLSSCFDSKDFYNYYSDGDYVFATFKNQELDSKMCLYGLTKEGQQKEFLILPKQYKGKNIDTFGIEVGTFYGGKLYTHDFATVLPKRIFINFELINSYSYNFTLQGENKKNYSFVIWYDFRNSSLYNFDLILNNRIYGYNLFKNEETRKKMDNQYNLSSKTISYIANVSYIYNYDDSPNDGYYWVDNYDNSLIEYIPPIPKRDGYLFGGWYKEEECINKWYFDSDRTNDIYEYHVEPDDDSTEEYKEFYYDYISNHTYV